MGLAPTRALGALQKEAAGKAGRYGDTQESESR